MCLETLTGHWVVVCNIVSSLILRIIPIMKHTEILYIYYHGVIHMCLETLTGHWVVVCNIVSSLILRIIPIMKHT